MEVSGVTVPPICNRDFTLLKRKTGEMFRQEYQNLGEPRLTPDKYLDLMEIVNKKLKAWLYSDKYYEELNGRRLNYAA